MKSYAILPTTDLNGSAGIKAPGEREERYRAYSEKQHLFAAETRMQGDNYGEAN